MVGSKGVRDLGVVGSGGVGSRNGRGLGCGGV